jgi:DNA-binding CsgD family transcriptional regulator
MNTVMELSSKDYQTLLDLICRLHKAKDSQSLFVEIWDSLRNALELTTGVFIPADRETGDFLLDGSQIFDHPSQYFLESALHFSSLDPFFLSGWFRSFSNDVIRLSDLVTPDWFDASPYAQDFLKRADISHILASNLGFEGSPVGILRLHRQNREKAFTQRDVVFLKLLAPHLSQTIDRFRETCFPEYSPKTGIMVMQQDHSIFWGNKLAKQIWGDRSAHEINSSAIDLPNIIHTSHGDYRVKSIPIQALKDTDDPVSESIKAKVLLLEPFFQQRSAREKLSSLGLSPRQAEIAALVLQGRSNRVVATELGISEQTVKDHLHDIFSKLKIKSRYQLIFLCANAM